MEERRKKHKFKSRKFWITIWAVSVISGFGILSIITGNDPGWMPGTLTLIAGIPVAYVTVGRIKEPKVGDK